MTKIKICGIKNVTDALAAMDTGADLIGFNFYPKSPRYIDVGRCRDIMSVMRNYGHIKYVGVFVNASVEEVRATMETCGLSLAQLHGDETPQMLESFNGKAFKAIRLSTDSGTDSRRHCWWMPPSKESTAEAASRQIGPRRWSWRRNIRCCWQVD
jgi:phosphoribosylanthranilate isomerase